MADKYDVALEVIRNPAIIPAIVAAVGSVAGYLRIGKGNKLAKQAVDETLAGNAKVAEVHTAVQAVAASAGTADGCETFARLVAENADLRREIERLKRERPVDGES